MDTNNKDDIEQRQQPLIYKNSRKKVHFESPNDLENTDQIVEEIDQKAKEPKQHLMCEICYETFEDEDSETRVDLFFKLEACCHTFCKDCFRDTFHSLIQEQNRYDELQCPHFACDARPSE